jgi:hypothetical protein
MPDLRKSHDFVVGMLRLRLGSDVHHEARASRELTATTHIELHHLTHDACKTLR